jgi:ATP-binding cassette subfamily F protein uup
MSLVQIIDVSFAIGELPILRGASLALEPGERIALIGRNGAGKSTLFKLIMGDLLPDSGEVRRRRFLRVSQLEQSLPEERPVTVFEHVAGGLDHLRGLIAEHQRLSQTELDAAGLRDLTELQHAIEDEGGWNVEQRVATVLTELDLPGERMLDELSGGWRRRVGLARALVSNPELLLLDEPTNHLDLATIGWLERKLKEFEGTLLFVTHDRAFLQSLATRVVEIERARLLSRRWRPKPAPPRCSTSGSPRRRSGSGAASRPVAPRAPAASASSSACAASTPSASSPRAAPASTSPPPRPRASA